MYRPILVIAAAAGLSACAAFEPGPDLATCQQTEWLQAGITDGQFGVPTEARDDLFADCAQQGAAANVALYRRGHAQGVLDYCTEPRGYEAGRKGERYRDVCPPALEPDFLAGYERGEDDRPTATLRPSVGVGVGIGPGGIRPSVGIGLSLGCFLFC